MNNIIRKIFSSYLLYGYLLFFLSLGACSKDELFAPVLYADLVGGMINVPIEGLQQDVKIITNVKDWKITTAQNADWCQYTILEKEGIKTVRFVASPNRGAKTREVEYTLSATGCKPGTIKMAQLGTSPSILLDVYSKKIGIEGEEFMLTVTSNVDYTYKWEGNSDEWLTITEQAPVTQSTSTRSYLIKVAKNPFFTVRTENLLFSSSEESSQESVVLSIEQEKAESNMGDAADIKLEVESAKLLYGNTYGDQTVAKTIDGDYTSNYSGRQVQVDNDSVVILYSMKQSQQIDYIKLTQRLDKNPNSVFSKGTLWIQKKDQPKWILKEKFSVDAGDDLVSDIQEPDVENVRLCLYRSLSFRNVALAEFECFQRSSTSQEIKEYGKYFTDETYSELKAGVTLAEIKEIKHPVLFNLATELYNSTYEKECRVRMYHSCKSPITVAKELTIGNRSQYDNPTGIFLEQNKTMMVFVGKSNRKPLTLAICDYRENGKRTTINLVEGLNLITPAHSGNGYIQYWTENDDEEVPVKVHFCYATELGFWDKRQGHTNEDWKRILTKASEKMEEHQITNAMIDVLGDKVQLMNTVNAFATYASGDIETIVAKHDELLYHEYALMGLEKNRVIPRNRFLGVRSWDSNPNWNGTCANFPNAENTMLVPASFLDNLWVFAHEFGHGNQVAQMKGAGWAEVTNNLYSVYVQYRMGDRNNLRLEHTDYKRIGSDRKVIGDRFNAYLNEAFVNKTLYLQQEGGISEEGFYQADPFVSLVPLWQLTLYLMLAGEGTEWYKPNFWADVHWAAIHDNNASYSWGQKYVNFMKRAVDASELNLCRFFYDMGLLRESDRMVGDYGGAKRVTITAAMVQEVVNYAQGKPEPASPVMGYISANSIDAFKNKSVVQGTYNTGLTAGSGGVTASHQVWKNVVAFETYKGDQLLDICISGTGNIENMATFVRYPKEATRIEAVGWDGTRILVLGTR